jgi:purine-cytosine permease-like protein
MGGRGFRIYGIGLDVFLGFGLNVCPLVVWHSGDIMGILCGILGIFWGYYVGFWGYYVADYLRYVPRDKIVMKNKDYKIIK